VTEGSGRTIRVEGVKTAHGYFERLRGLIGSSGGNGETALFIPSCRAVHTFFMRFDLDIVFLNGSFRVVQITRVVPPSRMVACRAAGGIHTLELTAGRADRLDMEVGDAVQIPS
jgi:uncharacterized membrane protein (UPF0127 family)